MKKYLLYLTIIPTTISIASSNVDLKLATNFGIGLEGGTYYNLYGPKYSKNTRDKAIFEDNIAYTGSFEAKVLKSFSIRKDLKVKVGAGTSIDITKLPILNKFAKEIGSPLLPHSNSWGVGLTDPFQSQSEKLKDQWGLTGEEIKKDDITTQMPKLIELSRKAFYTSLTVFGTIEVEKKLKNFSIYFGVDVGLDIVLEKIEETATFESKYDQIKYTLERRKSIVRPKVKGYTGINYKGFETEIGLGYPQFVTIGIGYRFNL